MLTFFLKSKKNQDASSSPMEFWIAASTFVNTYIAKK
jgi:hypothetical protein